MTRKLEQLSNLFLTFSLFFLYFSPYFSQIIDFMCLTAKFGIGFV